MNRRNILLGIFISILSIYILYEHVHDCDAIRLSELQKRHLDLIHRQSEFYNPWQYRIFSTYLLEFTIKIYDKVKELVPFQSKIRPYQGIIPYLVLSFVQTIILLWLFWKYLGCLKINNEVLKYIGLLLLGYQISNSTFASDLSYNIYFDIIFYILAAIISINGKFVYLPFVILLAALNRETSGFIPFMILYPVGTILKSKFYKDPRVIYSAVCAGLFVLIFIMIRVYFGYRQAHGIHNIHTPAEFLLFNITFPRMYMELFGTLGYIPVIILLGFRHLEPRLKYFFWLIVPLWFVLHLTMAQAMETRLFLVPVAVCFIPSVLYLVLNAAESKSMTA